MIPFSHQSNGQKAILLFTFYNMVTAQTNTTSCSPASCNTSCNPMCASDQVCVLKSMTECGVCPKPICTSPVTIGKPTNTNNQSSSNDTGPLVGGIVGGLIGLGVIIALVVVFYFKRKKKANKLPFAISHNMSRSVVAQPQIQEKSEPHPAVVAALARQNELNNNNNNTPKLSTEPTIIEETTEDEEDFDKKIAQQNKRISEILLSNPRLSYHQSYPTSLQPPQLHNNAHRESSHRNSRVSTYTTEDESEFDDDKKSIASVATNGPLSQKSVAVVQVVRAKPQIMRVNSVRSVNTTGTGGGLSRSESVRTVLTSVNEIPKRQQSGRKDNDLTIPTNSIYEDDEELPQFPTTPNNLSFATEDPFLDSNSIPSEDTTEHYFNNKSSS